MRCSSYIANTIEMVLLCIQWTGFDGGEDGDEKVLELQLQHLEVWSQVCPSR